jgi:hypothetical protein
MCRLTVQAPEGAWQGEVTSWTGLVVLASLSAEPETLGELAEAIRRYLPAHRLFDERLPAADVSPVEDGPWCLIDLAGRTVVAGGDFELPGPRDAYQADPEDHAEGHHVVWLDTPADWLFREAGDDWRTAVAARATARAPAGRVDARAVLLGPPLLEHLARGVLAAVAAGEVAGNRRQERTRGIHAEWLLSPRADLGGRTPRAVLHADRGRIAWDLQHRAEQWSMQGRPAPALPPGSAAYRFGGFGTAEVVVYFDLVRELLAEAWERAEQEPRPTQADLVERLAERRDRWLHEPDPEIGLSLTPAELIESERRRMPVAGDGSHLDCDCPLCQATATGEFGPAFLCIDGHHLELEDEFAFSLCETREEWERGQEEYRRFSEEMDRKMREREAEGPLGGSVWQTSFVDWDGLDGPETSPQQMLLALGFPLAELVGALQRRGGGTTLLKPLNGAYGALRTSQEATARGSVAQELRDLLETVGEAFPDLLPRCADLQSRLDEVLRRLS